MGLPFYVSAYKSLKHSSANMDVLIVVGTTSAWLYGTVLFFVGYPEEVRTGMGFHHELMGAVHNFETSSILILIVLLGKYIESYSKLKTIEQLSSLASLKVATANLLTEKDEKNVSLNS